MRYRGGEKGGEAGVCVCVGGGTSEVRGRDLSGTIEFAGERADIVCERKTKRERGRRIQEEREKKRSEAF